MYILCMRAMTTRERTFFRRVADTVRTNPFSEDRRRGDVAIAGLSEGAFWEDALARMVALVKTHLDALRPVNVADAGADRENLELSILFFLFQSTAPAVDLHIQDQLSHGARPRPVTFADDFIRFLAECGFSATDATRYFAMSFQFRRAFFFIERGLPGESRSMRRLRESLWNNVFTYDIRLYARHLWKTMEDFSTFVLGETGSGKGTAAAAIGRSCFIPFDERKGAFAESFVDAFTTVNLSQFAAGLLESELFGHTKGAFTGAVTDHEGAFSRCSPHGAILLDEIGEIDVPVQIKLLRVLQERSYTPVGSHEPRRFSGRIIAATNQSLDALREQGRFRDDFYYRLCSDVIRVPTLRERIAETPSELDVLLVLIVRRILGEDAPAVVELAREAIERDLGPDYPWPGNVRELEQCVRRVILTRAYHGDARLPAATPETAEALLAKKCAQLYRELGTYGDVARRMHLDWRTVKKYVNQAHGDR